MYKDVQNLLNRVSQMKEALDLSKKQDKLVELEKLMVEADFWQKTEANKTARQAGDLKNEIDKWKQLEQQLQDYLILLETEDQKVLAEIEVDLKKIEEQLATYEIETLFSGEYDGSNAILSINAGAGGDDSQDWAEILLKMYLKFIELQGWKVSILNRSNGQIAGLKSITIEVDGYNAYGYLKAEAGVHRLVRLSPFNADHARHTSFAMVEVVPELSDINIDIKEDDLRIDVFRSSGNGGQSVNTTDSAVRITHLPTGIVAVCQNERSQLQNKEKAKQYLYGKLATYYQAQKEEERLALRGELTEAAWGNQIRSYVLHPYRLVKDHRTKFESNDPDKILNGDLLPFIESYLKYNLNKNK